MASKTRVAISELSDAVTDYLRVWDQEINKSVDKLARRSMKELVEKTRETAPVGHRDKHYRDSITFKSEKTSRTTLFIWYVEGPNYRLSHLLEKGHALRDGGRTEGTHFIQNASDPILEEYIKAVEEVIKNG